MWFFLYCLYGQNKLGDIPPPLQSKIFDIIGRPIKEILQHQQMLLFCFQNKNEKKRSKTKLKIDFKDSHFEVIDFTFCDLEKVLVTGIGYRSVYLAPRVLLLEFRLKVPHRKSYPSGLEETISAQNKASVE